jgi:hypothetical protein
MNNNNKKGRAVAQAVNRRLATAAPTFKPWSGNMGFFGEQSGAGADFL